MLAGIPEGRWLGGKPSRERAGWIRKNLGGGGLVQEAPVAGGEELQSAVMPYPKK